MSILKKLNITQRKTCKKLQSSTKINSMKTEQQDYLRIINKEKHLQIL